MAKHGANPKRKRLSTKKVCESQECQAQLRSLTGSGGCAAHGSDFSHGGRVAPWNSRISFEFRCFSFSCEFAPLSCPALPYLSQLILARCFKVSSIYASMLESSQPSTGLNCTLMLADFHSSQALPPVRDKEHVMVATFQYGSGNINVDLRH